MNNQWIEHKGGECPVADDTFVKVKFRGMLSDGGEAKSFNWEHWDDEEDIIAYWHADLPDPHKEWVKIQEGCVMPEEGEMVVVFDSGHQETCQFVCGSFLINITEFDGREYFDVTIKADNATHWRYPHPDPEDV